MADEKMMKPTNESESKQDRPKRRYHRRSSKAAKPAEEATAASGEELVSTPKPSHTRKKTLDEAIAAVIGATAVAEPEKPREKKQPTSRKKNSRPAKEAVPAEQAAPQKETSAQGGAQEEPEELPPAQWRQQYRPQCPGADHSPGRSARDRQEHDRLRVR